MDVVFTYCNDTETMQYIFVIINFCLVEMSSFFSILQNLCLYSVYFPNSATHVAWPLHFGQQKYLYSAHTHCIYFDHCTPRIISQWYSILEENKMSQKISDKLYKYKKNWKFSQLQHATTVNSKVRNLRETMQFYF